MTKRFPQKLVLPQMNMLFEIHSIITGFPTELRIRICEECNWSTPTFYRKMRSTKGNESANTKKIKVSISNAEKEKILQIFDELYPGVGIHVNKLRAASKK